MDFRQAIALQRELAGRVLLADCLPRPLRRVAGVDVSYEKHGDLFFAAVVVLSFPELEPVEEAFAVDRVTFPYVPGLLSFRELPVVLEAFRSLRSVPDAVLVDGQGIAHPRRHRNPRPGAVSA
jgi:deoxyribonuclease V